ncbi:hypothetical protein DBR28_12620 [Chryseobacterium sp. HMWF028]|nr:hypothetical protein DBR28_12620 [Chryseobacterium sp. HMWF028]
MLLFRHPLNSYFNYLIYLDVKEVTILQRGKIRDVPKFGIEILDKYKTRYIPVLRRYLVVDNPFDQADIVIINNDYSKPEILLLKYNC